MNETLKQKLKCFASSIVGGIKGALGIKSPSRVMAGEVGKFIPFYEKTLYLQDVKNKIEVLEQKIDDGIITRKEIIDLHGLYKIKKKTEEDIDKLYSID